jgi:hypothetical protein
MEEDLLAALREVVCDYRLTIADALVIRKPLTGAGPTKRTDVSLV